MIYRRVQKENDELLYTVRSLVMVREPVLPARRHCIRSRGREEFASDTNEKVVAEWSGNREEIKRGTMINAGTALPSRSTTGKVSFYRVGATFCAFFRPRRPRRGYLLPVARTKHNVPPPLLSKMKRNHDNERERALSASGIPETTALTSHLSGE